MRAVVLVGAVLAGLVAGVAPAGAVGGGPVVFVGVAGLRWEDLRPGETPALAGLAGRAAVGLMSARTVGPKTCPADGWASAGAGTRTATGPVCRTRLTLRRDGPGAAVAEVPGMARYTTSLGFPSRMGALAEAARRGGECVAAVGTGAALAAADPGGRVDRYSPAAGGVRGIGGPGGCRVTLVDPVPAEDGRLGALPLEAGARAAAVRRVDAVVSALLRSVPPETTVLVAGVADEGTRARLRLAMAAGRAFGGRSVGSASTRQDDLVMVADVAAAVLHAAGIAAPEGMVGTPWRGSGVRDEPVGEIERLKARAAAPEALKTVAPGFGWALLVLPLALYGAGLRALWRGGARPAVRTAAVGVAALPAAAFLVNLLPWSRAAGLPGGAALLAGIVLCDLAVTALALAGPWGRRPLGPALVVAGATAATLAADQALRLGLQVNSLMGYSHLGGWRYFGMGNIGFAVFTVSALLAAGILAHRLDRAGRPKAALAVLAGLPLAVAPLDGLPMFGSDFGGLIAFLPGIAVAVLAASGRRISAWRLAGLTAAAFGTVLAIGWLDHLRAPDRRTHLGRFVGDLLEGGAAPVVERKITAMLHSFANLQLTAVTIAAVLFLAVLRPRIPAAPLVRAGVLGALTTLLIGTLVNDSGVSIAALGLTVVVPLLLAAAVAPSYRCAPKKARIRSQPSSAAAGS